MNFGEFFFLIFLYNILLDYTPTKLTTQKSEKKIL